MADTRRRRVPPRRRQDDSESTETLESQEGDDVSGRRSDAGSHSDAESDTIFDKNEEVSEVDSTEEGREEVKDSDTEDGKRPSNLEDGSEVSEVEDDEDGQEEADNEDKKNTDKTDDNLDADQDLKNPAYIPRRGPYFMHDVRSTDAKDDEKEKARPDKKKLWQEDNKWLHDKYIEEEQAPKPRGEMMAVYGYDVRSSDKVPTSGLSRQPRRGPRGNGPDRGRSRFRPRDRYANQDSYDKQNKFNQNDVRGSESYQIQRDGYNRQRAPQSRQREDEDNKQSYQEEKNKINKEYASSDRNEKKDDNWENGTKHEDWGNHARERRWSGRSRGRGYRGKTQEDSLIHVGQNAADKPQTPYKTEWVNSSSSGRKDHARSDHARSGRQKGYPIHDEQRQRIPVDEDFPALGSQQDSGPPPLRETRSYQRDRPQRTTSRQEMEPSAVSREGSWAGAVARQAATENDDEKYLRGDSQKSQGLLPTPPSTGKVEASQDVVPEMEKMQGDKREPPKPKRYSSQRQRPAAEPSVTQAQPVLKPAKFYQSEQPGPPPGYQHQTNANTPPSSSSPQQQHLGGGATSPHVQSAAVHSVHGGATSPGMGVVPSSQAPPGIIPSNVMPHGVLLQDVPMHPGMQHSSPTHMGNPTIIHPASMRPQPPLPQGSFPPPPSHFVVNYGASPGQQYQLNNPVPMQRFPQAAVANLPPHTQPPPLQQPSGPIPNQSLPLSVQPMLPQQPPPGGSGGPLQPPGQGQPPSQTYGGVTYYSPEQQQQGVKRVQPKRTVNPIRIEEPPQRTRRQLEQQGPNSEESEQRQQQPVSEGVGT